MQLDLQYFATPDYRKQHTAGLRKTIRSLNRVLREHQDKITDPSRFYPDWSFFDTRYQEGLNGISRRKFKIFLSNYRQHSKSCKGGTWMEQNEMALEALKWIAKEIQGRYEESQHDMKEHTGDEFAAGRALAYQELMDIVNTRTKALSIKVS